MKPQKKIDLQLEFLSDDNMLPNTLADWVWDNFEHCGELTRFCFLFIQKNKIQLMMMMTPKEQLLKCFSNKVVIFYR